MLQTRAQIKGPPPSASGEREDHLQDPLATVSKTPQAAGSTRKSATHRSPPTRGPGDKDLAGGGGGTILNGEKPTKGGQALAKAFGKSHTDLNVTGSTDRAFTMPYEGRGSADVFTGTTALSTVLDQGSLAQEFAERWPKIQYGLGSPEDAWSQAQLHDQNKGGTHASMGFKRRTKGTKRAVVVGNSDYKRKVYGPLAQAAQDKAGPHDKRTDLIMKDLPGAASDRKTIAGIYRGMGFEVIEHAHEDHRALRQTLDAAESGLVAGDELLIYYAGHGDTTGLYGADANKRVVSDGHPFNTIVPFSVALDAVVGAKMGDYHATVVLDACHSGAAIKALKVQGADLGKKERHTINLAEEALRDTDGDMDKAKKKLNFGGERFGKWTEEQGEKLPGS